VVKANKALKDVQSACEGLRGNVVMGRLQERYLVGRGSSSSRKPSNAARI